MEPRIPRWIGRCCPAVLLIVALACHPPSAAPVPTFAVVEAACGQCQFEMPGSGCDLAVRIDGRTHFVRGSGIDDHGDAHGPHGLCNAVRQARVEGHVAGQLFVATQFELLPLAD